MTKDGDLDANYAGAFDGHLSFGKTPALLIVDFVLAYLEPASPLYAGVEDALASQPTASLGSADGWDTGDIHQCVLYSWGLGRWYVLSQGPGSQAIRARLSNGGIPTQLAARRSRVGRHQAICLGFFRYFTCFNANSNGASIRC